MQGSFLVSVSLQCDDSSLNSSISAVGVINNDAVLIEMVPADINGVIDLNTMETDSPGNNLALTATSKLVLAANPATDAAGKD